MSEKTNELRLGDVLAEKQMKDLIGLLGKKLPEQKTILAIITSDPESVKRMDERGALPSYVAWVIYHRFSRLHPPSG